MVLFMVVAGLQFQAVVAFHFKFQDPYIQFEVITIIRTITITTLTTAPTIMVLFMVVVGLQFQRPPPEREATARHYFPSAQCCPPTHPGNRPTFPSKNFCNFFMPLGLSF